MFVLFTFSFGDDFYIAAIVLISIELAGQLLKVFDYSYLYEIFKEKGLVNDPEVVQKTFKQTEIIIRQYI